jgi:hypothetical protein
MAAFCDELHQIHEENAASSDIGTWQEKKTQGLYVFLGQGLWRIVAFVLCTNGADEEHVHAGFRESW